MEKHGVNGKLMDALENGCVAAWRTDDKNFAISNGHYMAIEGLTEDGKIILHDPDSVNWEKNHLKDGFENGFAPEQFSRYGGCFYVYKRKDESVIAKESERDESKILDEIMDKASGTPSADIIGKFEDKIKNDTSNFGKDIKDKNNYEQVIKEEVKEDTTIKEPLTTVDTNTKVDEFRDDIKYSIKHKSQKTDGILSSTIVAPESLDDSEKIPLTIWLPGLNGEQCTEDWFSKSGPVATMNESELKKSNSINAFIRSGNCKTTEQILEYIEQISQEYNVDPSRIRLVGYSEGANTAIRVASEAEGVFERVAVLSAGTAKEEWLEKIEEGGTEIKGFVGSDNKADGAYNYMTGNFAEHFDVEVMNAGHNNIRETVLNTDSTGSGISDLEEWLAYGDSGAEEIK